MAFVILSWIVIFFLAFSFGNAFIEFAAPGAYKGTFKLDIYVVCGLMILNVFAQVYSLFAGVGKDAFLIVAFIAIVWCVWKHKQLTRLVLHGFHSIKWWKLCVCIIVILIVGLWTLVSPTFVDTYLYHAQAIRWIEEYGVVPGLGNLHNRFAYNSAFMPLQALLNFSWVYEPSMHSLNGFLCAFFVVYSIVTNKFFLLDKGRVSDLLKLVIPLYVYLSRRTVSSPCSDILAMLLVVYIYIKWFECIENDETDIQGLGVICLIAVWAISVKLSAAVIIILAIYPAIVLIREKRWNTIIIDLVSGVIILLPWLIRNVIISGYLIYPYPVIDLFNVDWKMPEALVDYDRKEIIVWGREVKDVSRYDDSIGQWSGTWYSSQMTRNKLLILVGLLAVVILTLFIVISIISKMRGRELLNGVFMKPQELLVVISVVISLVFWIFSAPLLRYGMVYLLIPTALAVHILREYIREDRFNKIAITIGAIIGCCFFLYKDENFRLIEPQGYWEVDNIQKDWYGFEIYVHRDTAEDELLTNYADFPGIHKERVLEEIEPRGNTLKDGFRPNKKD